MARRASRALAVSAPPKSAADFDRIAEEEARAAAAWAARAEVTRYGSRGLIGLSGTIPFRPLGCVAVSGGDTE